MHRLVWSLVLAPCLGCLAPHDLVPATTTSSTATTSADGESSSTGTSTASSESTAGHGHEAEAEAEAHAHTDTSASSTGDTALCGDSHLDPGEECDNGFANSDDAVCLLDCLVATCGDGHVFAAKEECDDANDDPLDGCHQCGRSRKVFVTSDIYHGHIFMGIVGADQRCRSLAAQADLPNFATYKAWISDSTTSPSQRMHRGRGRYELVNGLLVADDWDDLLTHGPKIPIVVDEHSETHESSVWTGTRPDGTEAVGSDHCADWTSQDPGHLGFWGVNTETNANWTLAESQLNPGDCGAPRALLCFEQE